MPLNFFFAVITVSQSMDTGWIEEVLRGHQIKLIHTVSNSEYHEYYSKDLTCFISVPSQLCGKNQIMSNYFFL